MKTAPLPDFYIGAHAAVERMSILTRDANRYVLHFASVEIIEP
jgi:predicted nucleic acid-binding protein